MTVTASEDRCPARRGAVNSLREQVIRMDSRVDYSWRKYPNGRENTPAFHVDI